MNHEPVKYLEQQFNTLISTYEENLIIEYIKPKYEHNCFTYQNLVSKTVERSPISQKYFSYCRQYLAFFKSRSYHFLFKDYSIGRFHYKFDNKGKLISYNLLWFPCPFSDEFLETTTNNKQFIFEILDSIELTDNFKHDDFLLRTPIRLDFDSEYKGEKFKLHPTAHIHFQSKDTRAKSADIFCLYKYILFIIENCYPDVFLKYYGSEYGIDRSMVAESKHWLKGKIPLDIKFGSDIYTSFLHEF